MAKRMTLQLCEIMQRYYSRIAMVFSGCAGFHVHVMDFDYRDWSSYREKDPIWCHSASRFKFTKLLQKQTRVFDRVHFTVSVDPMRVVTEPNTLNGKAGLICRFIGSPKNLQRLNIPEVLELSKTFPVQSHLEALDSPLVGSNGPMKSCVKKLAEAA